MLLKGRLSKANHPWVATNRSQIPVRLAFLLALMLQAAPIVLKQIQVF